MFIIRVLTLNPFIGLQLAALLQTFLMVFLIIGFNIEPIKEKNEYFFRLLLFLKTFFQGIYAIFGILMLDIAVFWLLGAWSYTDWKFHLPSVIIIILLGIQYVTVPLYKKGYFLDILFSIVVVSTFGIFIHFWVSQFAVMGPKLEDNLLYILLGLVFIDLLIALIKSFIIIDDQRQYDDENNKDNPKAPISIKKYVWNKENEFNKIFNVKFNFIMWIFALIQSILFFSGYSILSIL